MKYTHIPINNQNSPLFEKGCLADIIVSYHRHVLNDAHKLPDFNVGLFLFSFYEHDTGTQVYVRILSPDGTQREIINCTYWNSNHYTFNKSFFESGKWDNQLEKTIDNMAEQVKLKIQEEKKEEERAKQETLAKQLAEKQKFEALFE